MKTIIDSWIWTLFLCATFGLAPWLPEPHIWGKLRWIEGGAINMKLLDWLDFFFHGLPFLLLLRLILIRFGQFFKKTTMKKILPSLAFLAALAFFEACKNDPKRPVSEAEKPSPVSADTARPTPETPAEAAPEPTDSKKDLPAEAIPSAPKPSKKVETQSSAGVSPIKNRGLDLTKWADVAALDSTIRIDIRYATANNFTKSKIYDCPACYLRPEAAAALVKAQKALKKQGFGFKMFDCYRPRPYQQRLWDKVPNPNYVTPPQKGSMHSRGAAVDLTLVDSNGKELDMGTEYDFFGPEAHTDFLKLPPKVLENRKRLKDALEAVGFAGIRTEWWHFSFKKGKYDLASEVWRCEK